MWIEYAALPFGKNSNWIDCVNPRLEGSVPVIDKYRCSWKDQHATLYWFRRTALYAIDLYSVLEACVEDHPRVTELRSALNDCPRLGSLLRQWLSSMQL